MSEANDIKMMATRLQNWSKHSVATELVKLVRAIYEPKSGWTLEAGRDCIEVLLVAAQRADPTAENVNELMDRIISSQVASSSPADPPITAVGRDLAEQIEEVKKELEGTDGQD